MMYHGSMLWEYLSLVSSLNIIFNEERIEQVEKFCY